MNYIITMVLVFLTINVIVHKCNNYGLPKITACPDFPITLGSFKNMAKVVDVVPGSTVHLYCHFCSEKNNFQFKVWYYKQRGSNKSMEELKPQVNKASRITISADHILKINSFSVFDSGIYLCRFDKHEESLFTYVLDGVFNVNVMSTVGTLNQWPEYKRTQLDPVNEKFDKVEEEPFTTLRDSFKFSFRILTSWERLGPCEVINHSREGIRKVLGRCRLHIIRAKNLTKSNSADFDKMANYFMVDNYDLSCRSIKLKKYLSTISDFVRFIPEYVTTETCDVGTHKFGKLNNYIAEKYLVHTNENNFKYKSAHQIAEYGHVTLICLETAIEFNTKWYKNEELLNSTYRNNMANCIDEPHITIDSNSLYILHATKNEEGVYTCIVDGKKMHKYVIQIVAKSRLLNNDFIRYSIYLGFILSLTITCYCAGICVAWHRKTYFVDPLNHN